MSRNAVAKAAHEALSAGRNHVTTVEVAKAAGVSTRTAYAYLCEFEHKGLLDGSQIAVKTRTGKELRDRANSLGVGAIAWQSASPDGYADELKPFC